MLSLSRIKTNQQLAGLAYLPLDEIAAHGRSMSLAYDDTNSDGAWPSHMEAVEKSEVLALIHPARGPHRFKGFSSPK